ncbi:hypothetical protein ABPG75_001972 [Micractinium tetrahymenae]
MRRSQPSLPRSALVDPWSLPVGDVLTLFAEAGISLEDLQARSKASPGGEAGPAAAAAACPPQQPLEEEFPLLFAAARGDAPAVQRQLQGGTDPNAAGPSGITAAHVAAALGDAEVLSVLLAAGADPLSPLQDDRLYLGDSSLDEQLAAAAGAKDSYLGLLCSAALEGASPVQVAAMKGRPLAVQQVAQAAQGSAGLAAATTAAAAAVVVDGKSNWAVVLQALCAVGADPLQPVSRRAGSQSQSCLAKLLDLKRWYDTHPPAPEGQAAEPCLQAAVDRCLATASPADSPASSAAASSAAASAAGGLSPAQRLLVGQALVLLRREAKAARVLEPLLSGRQQWPTGGEGAKDQNQLLLDCARCDAPDVLCRLLDAQEQGQGPPGSEPAAGGQAGPQPPASPPPASPAPHSQGGPGVRRLVTLSDEDSASDQEEGATQPPNQPTQSDRAEQGRRLLEAAAAGGALCCIAALLARGVPVDATRQDPAPPGEGLPFYHEDSSGKKCCGTTALGAAAATGQLAAAQLLIGAGAAVDGLPQPPDFLTGQSGFTRRWAPPPLGQAVLHRRPALVRLLLRHGADPDQLWKGGHCSGWWCPLVAACQIPGTCAEERAQRGARSEIAGILLEAGADPNLEPPHPGFRCMHGGDLGLTMWGACWRSPSWRCVCGLQAGWLLQARPGLLVETC